MTPEEINNKYAQENEYDDFTHMLLDDMYEGEVDVLITRINEIIKYHQNFSLNNSSIDSISQSNIGVVSLKDIENQYAKSQNRVDFETLLDVIIDNNSLDVAVNDILEHVRNLNDLTQSYLKEKISKSEINIICEKEVKNPNKSCMACYGGGCESPIVNKTDILNVENIK